MKPKKPPILPILILLLITFTITLLLYTLAPPQTLSNNQQPSNNTVTRIIDGDTFELANKEKVRLICIDTPEKNEQGYEEATEFLSNLILNKEVRLETDISNRDKYNRLLRYVYVNISNKEVFINREIVQQGYGDIYRYKPDVKRCGEIEG